MNKTEKAKIAAKHPKTQFTSRRIARKIARHNMEKNGFLHICKRMMIKGFLIPSTFASKWRENV